MKNKIDRMMVAPILLTVAIAPLAADVGIAIMKDGLIPFWRVGLDLFLGLLFAGVLMFLLDD